MTDRRFSHDYQVWAESENIPEVGTTVSACFASFTYMQEALDYVVYVTKRGIPAVLRFSAPGLSTRWTRYGNMSTDDTMHVLERSWN